MKIDGAKEFLYKIQENKKSDESFSLSNDGRKNILDLKILVCLDISGSISPVQFKQFMAQVDLIKGLSTVKVLETDDKAVALYDYFKTKEKARIIRILGGGGTAFTDAFNLAKKMEPDAVLFMTDGMVSDNVKDPGIPTGWILTHDGQIPYKFGDLVLKLPPPSF